MNFRCRFHIVSSRVSVPYFYVMFLVCNVYRNFLITEVAVDRHENEGVDARVGAHMDEVLDHLTPDDSERPDPHHVVGRGEGHAEYDEEQIGTLQQREYFF